MKKHLTALFVLCSILAADAGGAAVTKAGLSSGHVSLSIGGQVTPVQAAAGLGFSSSGSSGARAGTRALPSPVDVWLPLDPKNAAFARALDFLSGKSAALPASILISDQNLALKQVYDLGNASITEVELPGADAKDSKTRVQLRMRLQPQTLDISAGSGSAKAASPSKDKAVLASNFRVSMDGTAAPEVISVSSAVVRGGGALQVSNLTVGVSRTDAFSGAWLAWAKAALDGGGKMTERTLVLEYLDPALKNVLVTIEFSGVSLGGLRVPKLENGGAASEPVEFELSARAARIR